MPAWPRKKKLKCNEFPENISSLSLSYLYSYYINWTDDLSHSCPHRYFTLNFTFAFAFVSLKEFNSEIILFRFALISVSIRSRPGKPNQRKDQNEKFMNFAHFCEFWYFSLGKQARFTLNFCSGTPLRKVHELTFFGLVCRGHS